MNLQSYFINVIPHLKKKVMKYNEVQQEQEKSEWKNTVLLPVYHM
jgi:hypothetical protein